MKLVNLGFEIMSMLAGASEVKSAVLCGFCKDPLLF